jgi:4-hydroxy-3-polyprenylbenzoate decarboxylase
MASRYRDLREFIAGLEERGELRRIRAEVDPYLEITEIADRTLRAGGPALLFENPRGHDIPLLANLFGTEQRVALGMGAENVEALREIGELLAYLRQPDPPKGLRDAWDKAPLLKQGAGHGPEAGTQSALRTSACTRAMTSTCAPCRYRPAGPVTRRRWSPGPWSSRAGRSKARQNLGIYRMQLLGRNKLIMRWLSHRGGALDLPDWQLNRTPASATPSPSPSAPTRPPPSAP